MNLPKTNIALDLDGIVANFLEPFKIWLKQKYDIERLETGKYNISTSPEITNKMTKELIAEFIRCDNPRIPVLPEGKALVEYLWNKCPYPLYFITARDISTAGATHRWIKRNFPGIDFALSIVNSGSDKWRYLDNYDCFIDDRRKTALDLAERGKIVFIPSREYNNISTHNMNGKIIRLSNSDDITTGLFDDIIFK